VITAAAHNEFAETEDLLAAAELITGCDYQWNRYDVVCLPTSFPLDGTGNPCLMFLSSSLLTGDHSAADVVAHEIAHAWTGNIVTNHVWDHFWLNEGWTVWLKRKITSHLKHNDEVGRLFSEIGLVHLHESIEQLGPENKFTQLVWPLRGEDPADAFSSMVQYSLIFCFVLCILVLKRTFFGNEEKIIFLNSFSQFRFDELILHVSLSQCPSIFFVLFFPCLVIEFH
jgi:leukotriene-A4 hydrolase